MTLSSRARIVLPALAAVALLVACNPLTLRRNEPGSYVSRYAGPSGAWLEASLSGTGGFDVQYRLLVDVDDGDRDCRDAATGAVEPCERFGSLALTDVYTVTGTGFRPAISPLDDDVLILITFCTQGGEPLVCPVFRVTERVVNGAGGLVGNLTDETGP